MPVFVAAVKLRRSRREGAQTQSTPVAYSSSEREFQSLAEDPGPGAEKACIEHNLRAFFTDFDSDKERAILKNSPPSCWRASFNPLLRAGMDGEAGTRHGERGYPPLSPGLQQGNPVLIPNGVEKSFKSRRPFSKLLCTTSVCLNPPYSYIAGLHNYS